MEDSYFLGQKFRKLETLEFSEVVWVSLWRLLVFNPQIKMLNVHGFPDDCVITNVVRLLKNVHKLRIMPGMMSKTTILETVGGLL